MLKEKETDTKEIAKGLFFVLSSQGVSLLLNITLNLFLPKLLSLEEFAYWQLFIFYTSCVGFFHLGVVDGIYIRFAGKDNYTNLKEIIKSSFFILLLLQIVISAFFLITEFFFSKDLQRFVFPLIAFMFIANMSAFISLYFQISNRILFFSKYIAINSGLFLLLLLSLYFLNLLTLDYIIFSYVLAAFVGLLYLLSNFTFVLKVKLNYRSILKYFKEYLFSNLVGFFVMISVVCEILLLGIGRVAIEKYWGLLYFGRISFVLTMTTFLLFFIKQLGVVIFPYLKSQSVETRVKVFRTSVIFINVFSLLALLCYPLICVLINTWLSAYIDSLQYLVLLLPMVVFEAKNLIVFNTYMKVLRKERILLIINFIALSLSFLLTYLFVYINNLDALVFTITFVIIVKSIISELYLSRILKIEQKFNTLFPLLIIIIFIYCYSSFGLKQGSFFYFLSVLIYLVSNYKQIDYIKGMFFNKTNFS